MTYHKNQQNTLTGHFDMNQQLSLTQVALELAQSTLHTHSFEQLLATVERVIPSDASALLIRQGEQLKPLAINYFGKSDGFTTYLRKKFKQHYIGLELEVNQKFAKNNRFSQDLMQNIKVGLSNTVRL